LLDVNLRLVEDAALYNGSGVTPIITGIYTYAPTFDAAAYAANAAMPKFEDGNLYDLIAVLRAVIMLDKGGKYDPKIVLMNPMDILRYKLLKDAEGRYLLPPFINADGTVIDGVRVVESSQVVANTLVIGDFDYAWLYDMGGTEVSMGWVNDQFIKNTFTILAERRLALLVRNSDLDGFRKVTSISAALTAITVVP
jgi:HK97 family phage major capsid protein